MCLIFNNDNHCYSPLSTAKSGYHASAFIVKMIEESCINEMFKILSLFTQGIRGPGLYLRQTIILIYFFSFYLHNFIKKAYI